MIMADEWKIKGFWMKTLFVFAAIGGIYTVMWLLQSIFYLILLWTGAGIITYG